MTRITTIAALFASACIAAAAPAAAQTAAEDQRFETAQRRFDSELAQYRVEFDRYQAARRNRPYSQNGYNSGGYNSGGYNSGSNSDPRYDDREDSNYDPVRDYRSGSQYRERVLASNERIYRGSDGRNYCRRSDGSTGLIVGASTNSMLGSVLSGVGSGTVGTLLGAILNRSASASAQVRCR